MTEKFQPVFLKNSPSMICDQILFLVKNSNINFELHETPFTLHLNIKKSFVHHWNKSHHFDQEDHHVQQHVNDPGHHAPLHPSVGQPGQLPVRPPMLSENIPHNQQHHNHQLPQQQVYSPQHHQTLVLGPQVQAKSQQKHQQPSNPENDTEPVKYSQHPPNPTQPKSQELLKELDLIQAEHQKTIAENLESQKEYAELEKAHRKLLKEHKELQAKHSKVCSEVKILKTDKEIVVKENNALSVAIKSTKKDSEASVRNSTKESEALKGELEKLMQYKIKHQEEIRQTKKMEKKLRQKEKKKSSKPDAAIAAVEEAKLVHSVQSEEETVQNRSETAKASDKLKDNENNLEPKTETFVFKPEDPRFLDFPSRFADWSEDQKKDAYENKFRLYVQKYFFIGSMPDQK